MLPIYSIFPNHYPIACKKPKWAFNAYSRTMLRSCACVADGERY